MCRVHKFTQIAGKGIFCLLHGLPFRKHIHTHIYITRKEVFIYFFWCLEYTCKIYLIIIFLIPKRVTKIHKMYFFKKIFYSELKFKIAITFFKRNIKKKSK